MDLELAVRISTEDNGDQYLREDFGSMHHIIVYGKSCLIAC